MSEISKPQLYPQHPQEKPLSQPEATINMLEQKGELGEFFAVLYKAAINEEPSLATVEIIASGSKHDPILSGTGGRAVHCDDSPTGKYQVIVNTDDGLAHYEKLLSTRKQSAEASIKKIGLDPVALDAKLLAGFVFLHELGHIVDFMQNAPTKELHEQRRHSDMEKLPIPQYNPVDLLLFLSRTEGQNWFSKALPALTSHFGVHSPDELIQLQDERYRSLPTEDIPDQFAAKVLRPFS